MMNPRERSVYVLAMASLLEAPESCSGDKKVGQAAPLPSSMGSGDVGEGWPWEPKAMVLTGTLGTSTASPNRPSLVCPWGWGVEGDETTGPGKLVPATQGE